MMYKITNITNEQKGFRDSFLGKSFALLPGESMLTSRPPADNTIWKIELQDKPTLHEKRRKQ